MLWIRIIATIVCAIPTAVVKYCLDETLRGLMYFDGAIFPVNLYLSGASATEGSGLIDASASATTTNWTYRAIKQPIIRIPPSLYWFHVYIHRQVPCGCQFETSLVLQQLTFLYYCLKVPVFSSSSFIFCIGILGTAVMLSINFQLV